MSSSLELLAPPKASPFELVLGTQNLTAAKIVVQKAGSKNPIAYRLVMEWQ